MSLTREDVQLLTESAAGWAGDRYDDARRRAALADATGYDPAAWREMADLGWLGLAVDDALGGFGGSVADLAALLRAVGGAMLAEPLAAVAGVAAPLVAEVAKADRAESLLGPIVAGDTIAVLSHYEPQGGFDRAFVTTSAAQRSGGWVLTGSKAPALHAGQAAWHLVTARDSVGQLGLFRVEPGDAGLTITDFRTVDGRRAAGLALDAVLAERLGGDAEAAVLRALDRGAVLAMAEAAGLIQTVLMETAEYLRDRQQFGRPLASFQVLQHRCVDMYVMMQETRATAEAAAITLSCGDGDDDETARVVAAAKVTGGRAALHVGRQIIQLHGGMGMSNEMRIGDVAKRLMTLEALHGNADHYLGRYAALVDTTGDAASLAIPA